MKTFADFGIDASPNSGQVSTTCPQCSGERKKKKVKCLSINTDEGIWCCHHCGWTGTLANGSQKTVNLHWRKPEYRKPEKVVESVLSNGALEWLGDRGISETTATDCGIYVSEVYMPQSEEVKKAFVFPYYRDGELVNAKYRSGKKEFRSEVGAERILYGLDDVKEGDTPVILVEGEMDKLSLWEAGFRNCVSVPEVCSRVTWPEGCKDANDVLKEYDKKILAECIEHAEPYPIVGTYTTGDLSEQLFDLYDNGLEKGVSTGWDSLDKHYLIRPGCFSVLTGIPGSGKSNWLDAMMVNIAKKHGWRFAIFSPENQPLEDHMSRIMEKYVGAPFRDGPNMRMTRDELENATEWAKEHFQWILPEDDHEWTLEKILDTARGLVRRYGIRGLVIDPWNELETQRGEFSETEFIGLCLKRARQFARRYGIHLWIVAHPAKMYRDKSGAYPVPSLWDISGSAHWRNKSDTGVVIYRDLADPDSKVVEIHVQKQRFRQDGGMGMSTLTYRHTTGSYIDHQ